MTNNKLTLQKEITRDSYTNELLAAPAVDSYNVSINTQSMPRLMYLLTNLYKDPIVATVRETLSNAIDATKKIPVADRKPIQVQLPTLLNSEFVVTDHALGMSAQEVKDIYTSYGTSTKTHDFTQVGSYGLGAKAPLSYTNVFSVSTIKDHELTTFNISVEQKETVVKVLVHQHSDADNCFAVHVPVKSSDFDKFAEACRSYYRHPLPDVQIQGLADLPDDLDERYSVSIYRPLLVMPYYDQQLEIDCTFDSSNITDLLRVLFQTHKLRDFDLKAELSGFEYTLFTGTYFAKALFTVRLIPGLVNFSSSRDEITQDSRVAELVKYLQKHFRDYLIQAIKDQGFSKLCYGQGDQEIKEVYSNYLLESYLQIPELSDPQFKRDLFTLSNQVCLSDIDLTPIAIYNTHSGLNQVNIGSTYYSMSELYQEITDHWANPQHQPCQLHWPLPVIAPFFDGLHGLKKMHIFYNVSTATQAINLLKKRRHYLEPHSDSEGISWVLLFKESQATVQQGLQQVLDLPNNPQLAKKIKYYPGDITESKKVIVSAPKPKCRTHYITFPKELFNFSYNSDYLLDGNERPPQAHSNIVHVALIIDTKQDSDHLEPGYDVKLLPYLNCFDGQPLLVVDRYYPYQVPVKLLPLFQEKYDYIIPLATTYKSKKVAQFMQTQKRVCPQMPVDCQQWDPIVQNYLLMPYFYQEIRKTIIDKYGSAPQEEDYPWMISTVLKHVALKIVDYNYNSRSDFNPFQATLYRDICQEKVTFSNLQLLPYQQKILQLFPDYMQAIQEAQNQDHSAPSFVQYLLRRFLDLN